MKVLPDWLISGTSVGFCQLQVPSTLTTAFAITPFSSASPMKRTTASGAVSITGVAFPTATVASETSFRCPVLQREHLNGRMKLAEGKELKMDYVKMLSEQQLKNEVPVFSIGDTVRVHVLIKEGTRERIQVFEGIVIARKNGGISETFTVRRITYGVGVERTFLLHSPKVSKIEVTRKGKVRRSKLYYLRDRVGKAAKTKQSFK